jgi:hypothetical protein
MEDQRLNLQTLPDENVFDIARNESAQHRELALRILVERGSLYAGRDEIADEARRLIIDNPSVRKKSIPMSGIHALKLPGVIDILADLQTRRIALTRLVDEHNAAHSQNVAILETTVKENRATVASALAESYATLWKYFAKQNWQLTQDHSAQKIDFDNQLADPRAEHEEDIKSASERLRLLERSAWQRLVDYLKKRNWIARRKLPVSDPPASG